MDDNLPVDELYDEGMPLGDILFEEFNRANTTWNSINWGETVDADDEVLGATSYLATQSHYLKTAHLLLCGKVIQHETENTSFDATQVAMFLTAYKLESINAWGKYLGRVGGKTEVSQHMKLYLRTLFSERNTLALFIGMEVLGGPLIHEVYNSLKNKGDTLYTQIVENLVVRKEQETEMIVEYLEPEIAELSWSEKQGLYASAVQYRNLAQNVLMPEDDVFRGAGVDVPALQAGIEKETSTFMQEIGLTQEQV